LSCFWAQVGWYLRRWSNRGCKHKVEWFRGG
jgi:hypothetical protein